MRFIPSTFMQSGECVQAIASNGVISGSFTSGSETWMYYEFGSGSLPGTNQDYQFEITKGYTTRARVIVIGGGGGGGWDGQGTYGIRGGGGGGGNVIQNNRAILYPTIYSVTKGKGGDAPDADNPSAPTYNGGTGGNSRVLGGVQPITATGGQGGFGNPNTLATSGDGGDSGAGFIGAQYNNFGSGGGAGSTQNGFQATVESGNNTGGNGGAGTTVELGYTSPVFATSSIQVGGGGGGGSTRRGTGVYGGGDGFRSNGPGSDGNRFTGGGGGGGAEFAYIPPAGIGTTGGDGYVIIMFPTGSCI